MRGCLGFVFMVVMVIGLVSMCSGGESSRPTPTKGGPTVSSQEYDMAKECQRQMDTTGDMSKDCYAFGGRMAEKGWG